MKLKLSQTPNVARGRKLKPHEREREQEQEQDVCLYVHTDCSLVIIKNREIEE